MKAQDLKNSILQLAIQGKLVRQREEEGTARELLKKIDAEKQALLKAGKIKKQKALLAITEDEIPFDIPESWEWVRLGELCNYGKCDSIMASNIFKEAWILDLEDVEKDTGRILNKKRMKDVKSSSNKHIFKAGDVLYSKLRPYLNKVVIADEDGYSTSEILPLNFGKNVYNRYAQMVLMSPFFINYTVKCSYGVKMPRLGTTDGQLAVFPLPPLAEQKRIVAKIEALMPYIDQYDTAYSEVEALNKKFPEELKKSILQYAIQGKLVKQRKEEGTAEALYQQIQAEKQKLIKEGKIKKTKALPAITEDEILFDIPESWKWVRLGEVIELLSGQDFPPDKYNNLNKGMPYITGASSLSESSVIINRWTEKPRCIANIGDVLLVCKGSGYGKTIICDVEEAHIARQIMAIKNSNYLNMQYLKYFLSANHAQIKKSGQGVIPGIDRKSVQNMLFPLPPLKEQQRIVEKIVALLPSTKKLEK